MPRIELVEVPLSDRKLVERFIRVPWHINREVHPSEHWVPPLLMDRRDYLNPNKNPFFEHATCGFWIARVEGKDVARIAAVDDAGWEAFHGDKVGYFGMFECPNDAEIAKALLDKASEWLRARGRTTAIGPMELSTNYLCGVLIEGFDRDPGMNMPYNPPYYDELLRSVGVAKAKDLYFWGIDLTKEVNPRVARIADRIKDRENMTVRTLDHKNWDDEVRRTLEIYNEAWEQNWGFVPISEKEYLHVAKDLKMVLHESLGLVAEVDGEAVAFAISIKDINPTLKKLDGRLFPTGMFRLVWDLMLNEDKAVRSGRLILLGIREKYRRRGVDSLLFIETFRAAQKIGWPLGTIGWTLDDNEMVNRAIEAMDGFKLSTYRLYETALAD